MDTGFVTVVIGLILEGRFSLIHLAPPCSSFSRAVNRFLTHAMRSHLFPAGLPNLSAHQEEKVRLGNALALVALRIAEVQEKAGGAWQFEQPASSLMVWLPEWLHFLARAGVFHAIAWMCAWGAPWAKPVSLYSSQSSIMIHQSWMSWL